jgi:hypothetical protein
MRNEFQNSKIGFRSEKFQKKQSFRFKKRRKPKISFFRVPKKGLAVAASLFSKMNRNRAFRVCNFRGVVIQSARKRGRIESQSPKADKASTL